MNDPKPEPPDAAFARELLEKVLAGEVHTLLVCGSTKAGENFIAGPGMEVQVAVLGESIANQMVAQNLPKPTPEQTARLLLPGYLNGHQKH